MSHGGDISENIGREILNASRTAGQISSFVFRMLISLQFRNVVVVIAIKFLSTITDFNNFIII